MLLNGDLGSQENGGGGKQTYIEFLSKQSSICSLTLSEVQIQTGQHMMKPYMALDAAYHHDQASISKPFLQSRKRMAEAESTEKTVEMRRMRMIKNRESAARSRARKQAYTNELENKITRLEEENERLRNQKGLDAVLEIAPLLEPKQGRLRRSISAHF